MNEPMTLSAERGGCSLQRPCSAIASLYKTTGPRTKDHVLVLYLAADKDWTARHFERNGNHWPALANVPMTPAAWDYRNSSARATSLRYSGKAPQDESGFVEDMRSLGFDEQTVEMLATAARPYWPNS